MNKITSLTSKFNDNKSKLYFSRIELNKILEYYSFEVARGNWKDYSIQFETNRAYFHVYKNNSTSPILSIFKIKKNKNYNFQLSAGNKKLLSDSNFENLFIFLKRNNFILIRN